MIEQVAEVQDVTENAETPHIPTAPKRFLVLETDGVTFRVKANTMSVVEALKGLENAHATLRACQQAAEKAAIAAEQAAKASADKPDNEDMPD